jgi:hypothetical protein
MFEVTNPIFSFFFPCYRASFSFLFEERNRRERKQRKHGGTIADAYFAASSGR